MVMHSTSAVFVLELDDSQILQLRVSVFQPLDELVKLHVAGLYILDVERQAVPESQRNELALIVKVGSTEIANSFSAFFWVFL